MECWSQGPGAWRRGSVKDYGVQRPKGAECVSRQYHKENTCEAWGVV